MITTLPLTDMHQRHYGLPPNVIGCFLLAARVSLDLNHSPPQEFRLEDTGLSRAVVVDWEPTNAREQAAMANQDDATRDGAYACALAAIEVTRGLVAVRRAERRSGVDYYLAPAGQVVEDLEAAWRLEVSGTQLNEAQVRYRLSTKMQQAGAVHSDLPALAAVVGFMARLIMIREVDSTP